MMEQCTRLDYDSCLDLLLKRLAEPAPARIQLLTGPRQVGKTTLLLELSEKLRDGAIYAAADGPEAALPGFWDRLWSRAAEVASLSGRAVLLIDEVQHVTDWAARLKGEWDRIRRRRTAIHVIASGSSALSLASGSKESLAGRFERLTMAHWSASAIAKAFRIAPEQAADLMVRRGGYPGAFGFTTDPPRWSAYVRDAIVEPAVGRDLLALGAIRRPGLLRQAFVLSVTSPAQIISLQKLQGQLQDPGALETIAHYLRLLEEAYLIAPLDKHSTRPIRSRASPPKLVTLNNALCAAVDPRGVPGPECEPNRFGAWVENACLAFAWNSGQRVRYWREEPYEVDGVMDGTWGSWAIEVKTGNVAPADLRGLLEFSRRHPQYRPLLLCAPESLQLAGRLGVPAMTWRQFLIEGPTKPGG